MIIPLNLIDNLPVEIKAKEVRHVYVPQYNTLTIEKIFDFLEDGNLAVFDYLPDKQEVDKISREWICNVCATIMKNKFTDWISKNINKRNEKLVVKNEMNIEMDRDIYDAFMSSTAVSSK